MRRFDLDHGARPVEVQASIHTNSKGTVMRKMHLSFIMIPVLCTALGCTPAAMPEPDEGGAFFAANCTACHGASGRGNGPASEGLMPKPTDLTLLAVRNDNVFPRARALAYIYGDPEQAHLARVMPQFGGAMAEDLVPVEIDGTFTPTPRVLAALLSYLESIQSPI